MSLPALDGVVLAGGHSRRMQRDKASLPYQGTAQLARAVSLLTPLVGRAYVSVRADQQYEPQRAAHPLIIDQLEGLGPIGGIQAALASPPPRAWLVLACDLPALRAGVLEQLIARRAPDRLATAYRSSGDGAPEPLCAIYEPAARAPIEAWIAAGQRCPRAFLAAHDVRLLDLPDPGALENVNTPADYAATGGMGGRRRLRIRYFALLREQAARSTEELETAAQTPGELYEELRGRYRLSLEARQLRVAINDEFADWQAPLADGDTVVFLPPVAGG